MAVTSTYVANLLEVIVTLALLPLMLTVIVTLTPTLPITVTLCLPHAPVKIWFVCIRPPPPSLSLCPSILFSLPPSSLSLSLSHSLSLYVCLSDICRGWHGGHIGWQCISDDGEQAGMQSASRIVQPIF